MASQIKCITIICIFWQWWYYLGMTKAGRPTIPKSRQKRIVIPIRVSADELRTIDHAARSAKLDRSKWARNILLSATRVNNITEGEGIEPTARMADEQV